LFLNLESCFSGLAKAECAHGPNSVQVAAAVMRIAICLECRNRGPDALPLWIRVLEIEGSRLGTGHPYVFSLHERIETILEVHAPDMDPDAVAAYTAKLGQMEGPRNCLVEDHPGLELPNEHASPAATSTTILSAVTSLGGKVATSTGGALASGALYMGRSVASSTCSLATGAASQVVGAGMRCVVGMAARPLGVPEAGLAVLECTSELAGRAAVGATVTVTSAVASAVVDVGTNAAESLVSSGAADALAHAGKWAMCGTADAVCGAWGQIRGRALENEDSTKPALDTTSSQTVELR